MRVRGSCCVRVHCAQQKERASEKNIQIEALMDEEEEDRDSEEENVGSE